jgi:hypothetical protein
VGTYGLKHTHVKNYRWPSLTEKKEKKNVLVCASKQSRERKNKRQSMRKVSGFSRSKM